MRGRGRTDARPRSDSQVQSLGRGRTAMPSSSQEYAATGRRPALTVSLASAHSDVKRRAGHDDDDAGWSKRPTRPADLFTALPTRLGRPRRAGRRAAAWPSTSTGTCSAPPSRRPRRPGPVRGTRAGAHAVRNRRTRKQPLRGRGNTLGVVEPGDNLFAESRCEPLRRPQELAGSARPIGNASGEHLSYQLPAGICDGPGAVHVRRHLRPLQQPCVRPRLVRICPSR